MAYTHIQFPRSQKYLTTFYTFTGPLFTILLRLSLPSGSINLPHLSFANPTEIAFQDDKPKNAYLRDPSYLASSALPSCSETPIPHILFTESNPFYRKASPILHLSNFFTLYPLYISYISLTNRNFLRDTKPLLSPKTPKHSKLTPNILFPLLTSNPVSTFPIFLTLTAQRSDFFYRLYYMQTECCSNNTQYCSNHV